MLQKLLATIDVKMFLQLVMLYTIPRILEIAQLENLETNQEQNYKIRVNCTFIKTNLITYIEIQVILNHKNYTKWKIL